MQVANQRGRGAVEQRTVLAERLEVLAVMVPAAEVERHDARTGLDQPAGDEEVLGQLRRTVVAELGVAATVLFDELRVFLGDVERIGRAWTR